MLDVMARARELDAFASQHDAQLAVHLHARGAAWSVGYIQQHARRHGFVPGVVPGGSSIRRRRRARRRCYADLRFAGRARRRARSRRRARRHARLRRAADRRRVEPFKAWQAAAQALAVGMDAAIVDDDGRPLSGAGFEAIGAELGALYTALEARGLAAGSASARRLFS